MTINDPPPVTMTSSEEIGYQDVVAEIDPVHILELKKWECHRDDFDAALLAYNTEPEPENFKYLRMSPNPFDEDLLRVIKMQRIIRRMKNLEEAFNSKRPTISPVAIEFF